jgi:hypothetical protein
MTATPWEYAAALLPICFEDRQIGGDIQTTAKSGRPVLMEYADEAERRRFLESLLALSWLPPKVRHAIVKSLGRSPRAVKVGIEQARTMVWRLRVAEVETRMRENGECPPGGFHAAAIEEVAEVAGISSEALAKRIERLRE